MKHCLKAGLAFAALVTLTTTAQARTLEVAAGADAQTRLQEALITAEPGDVVQGSST
jgi:hypothetical protein